MRRQRGKTAAHALQRHRRGWTSISTRDPARAGVVPRDLWRFLQGRLLSGEELDTYIRNLNQAHYPEWEVQWAQYKPTRYRATVEALHLPTQRVYHYDLDKFVWAVDQEEGYRLIGAGLRSSGEARQTDVGHSVPRGDGGRRVLDADRPALSPGAGPAGTTRRVLLVLGAGVLSTQVLGDPRLFPVTVCAATSPRGHCHLAASGILLTVVSFVLLGMGGLLALQLWQSDRRATAWYAREERHRRRPSPPSRTGDVVGSRPSRAVDHGRFALWSDRLAALVLDNCLV